jgi:hypothetical protein
MRFPCRITEANYGSLHFTVHYHFFHDFQIPSDVIKCVTAKLTNSEKLRNDISVIRNVLDKWYVQRGNAVLAMNVFNSAINIYERTFCRKPMLITCICHQQANRKNRSDIPRFRILHRADGTV